MKKSLHSPFPILHARRGSPATLTLARRAGFTIVEMLVTTAIFALVSGIILSNYGSFSSRTLLDNLAYEMALALREAQVFGVSTREFGEGSGVFPTYGVHFSASQTNVFTLFADSNENDVLGFGETVRDYTLSRGYTIASLCGYTSAVAPCTTLSSLDVTFTRPDPDATIVAVPAGSYAYVGAVLQAPKGQTRAVSVWSNGQITVE